MKTTGPVLPFEGSLILRRLRYDLFSATKLDQRGPVRENPRMHWYNPRRQSYEWRNVPKGDEEALELLVGPGQQPRCAEVYRYWRELGASVMAPLIRGGEAEMPGGQEGD